MIDIKLLNICQKISNGVNVNKNFSLLIDLTSEKLNSFIFYMLGSKSDDILQEVYITFYEKIEKGQIPDNPNVYLKQIARNLTYSHLRNKKIKVEIKETTLVNYDFDSLEDKQLLELIKKAVVNLDSKLKEVFILREFDGLSHKDISEICKITQENSRMRLVRAHKQLNNILNPYIKEIKEI